MNNNLKRTAVIIPVYKPIDTQDELLSFYTTVYSLDNNVYLICPLHLLSYCNHLAEKIREKIYVKSFDNLYFSSLYGYNKLMLSVKFYSTFIDYKYILIAQLDTLIFGDSNSLNYFEDLNFSYIGAPWVDVNKDDEVRDLISLSKIGNGGLSLRKTSDMINILIQYKFGFTKPKILSNILNDSSTLFAGIAKYFIIILGLAKKFPIMNEDKFICNYLAPYYEKFKISDFSNGLIFSFEERPADLYIINNQKMPFGCHGWIKYDKKFWMDNLIGETENLLNIKFNLTSRFDNVNFDELVLMNIMPSPLSLKKNKNNKN